MKTNLREWLTQSSNIEPDVHVEKDDDLVERSLKAFEYLRAFDTLNKNRVKEAHRELMEGRQPSIAGEFRDNQVRIGDRTGTPPGKINFKMNTLLMSHKQPETGVQALDWHIDFEQIHPFADGNGRIGRILYLWHCDKANIEPMNLGGDNRQAYYDLFP